MCFGVVESEPQGNRVGFPARRGNKSGCQITRRRAQCNRRLADGGLIAKADLKITGGRHRFGGRRERLLEEFQRGSFSLCHAECLARLSAVAKGEKPPLRYVAGEKLFFIKGNRRFCARLDQAFASERFTFLTVQSFCGLALSQA